MAGETYGLLLRTFDQMYRGLIERLPAIIAAVVVLILFALGGRILTSVFARVAEQKGGRRRHNFVDAMSRLISAAVAVLGLLVAAVIVFPTFRPGDLITGLGITSVAVGFAFKDVLQNFFAGILILWRQPFDIGDEIQSGQYAGVVEDISTRSTRIRTYDGERAVIPNGEVYTNAVLVRTAYPNRRTKVVVGIGYPDSIEEARRVILDVLAGTKGVLQDPGPWVYVEELAPSSVNLTVYFWTASAQRELLAVRDRAVTGIKLALDSAQIDLPYPHTVVVWDKENPSP